MQAGEEPVTATWEEARPPHLPDRITAIPVMVWPFVVITALVLYIQSRVYTGGSFDASIAVSFGLAMGRLGAMTLLGAALFLRHPDAWSRLRPVAVAVSLLAVAEALDVLAPAINDVLGGEWDGETFPIITISYVVRMIGSVVAIVGVVSLWFGLRSTRRTPDAGWGPLFIVLSLAGLAAMAIGYGRVLDDGWSDAEQALAAASTRIALAVLAFGLVAWLAVASVLVVGIRSRERPAVAWRSGAVAALAIAFGFEPIYYLWPTVDPAIPGISISGWVVSVAAATGAVLLLVAFLLGLPEPVDAEGTPEPT